MKTYKQKVKRRRARERTRLMTGNWIHLPMGRAKNRKYILFDDSSNQYLSRLWERGVQQTFEDLTEAQIFGKSDYYKMLYALRIIKNSGRWRIIRL